MIPNPKNEGIRQAIHVAQGYRGRPGISRDTGKGYGTDDAVFPAPACTCLPVPENAYGAVSPGDAEAIADSRERCAVHGGAA